MKRLSLLLALVCIGAGDPPSLIGAVKSGDAAAVRALLQQKIDVNAAEADGATALHWASYRDDLASADALLRAGANVNAANDLGATALWMASMNGSAGMVRRLLDAGANPDAKLLSGETPVMVASRSGHAAVVQLLVDKKADVNVRASRNQTALMWAVAQKHPEVVTILLAHGADVKAQSDTWTNVEAVPPHGQLEYNRAIPHGGDTALMFAARVGDLPSARLLVRAGANVNDKDAWGVSALVLAAHSGFEALVDFLLEAGADVNSADAGFGALHEAILRRNEHMVTALLAHGADPNAPLRTWTPTRRSSKDWNFYPELVGATPFWLAARFNETSVMRQLVARGADPKFVHRAEYIPDGPSLKRKTEVTTTLMAAAGMGGGGNAWVPPPRSEREALMLESVKLLVDYGVDLNAENPDGRTALDAAATLKFESVVKFLTEKGAKRGKPQKKEEEAPPK
ncbi:MAG TPA: ankyrin repeat domain-containing protein [Vicinamibacterales bacterium]